MTRAAFSAQAWYRSTRRVRGNVGAMVGIALLLVVLVLAVFADVIAPYSEAARSVGCLDHRIIVRHLLPNSVAPVLVQATMDAGIAILTTASLSFVGLGAVPPTPEWGAMVAGGRNYILTAWWIPTFPGILISMTVAGFMFLGDGLRDLLDPTLRGRVGF